MKTHVKMVEAFEGFAGICSGLGGKYKPGEENLQLTALTSLLAQAKAALHNVTVSKSRLDAAKNERAVLFQKLERLTAQILFRLAATGVSDHTLRDARAVARNLRGQRASARQPLAADAKVSEGGKTHSVLQLAHVSKADHFGKLVQLLKGEPLYKPQEEELSVPALGAYLAALQKSNSQVLQARNAYTRALRERDEVLYHGAHSLVATAQKARIYVRALFGLNSPEYRAVRGLYFTNLALR